MKIITPHMIYGYGRPDKMNIQLINVPAHIARSLNNKVEVFCETSNSRPEYQTFNHFPANGGIYWVRNMHNSWYVKLNDYELLPNILKLFYNVGVK